MGILQMILHCWQMYLDLFLSNSEIIKASTSSPRKLTAFGNGRSLNSKGFLVSTSSTCLSSSCVDVNSSVSSSPEKNANKNEQNMIYFLTTCLNTKSISLLSFVVLNVENQKLNPSDRNTNTQTASWSSLQLQNKAGKLKVFHWKVHTGMLF